MRITSFFQFIRLVRPTGVGKHIENVISIVAKSPQVELSLLAAAGDFLSARRALGAEPFPSIQKKVVPIPRRALELAWQTWRLPRVEWCVGRCDWVYCPAEYFVAAQHAKLAVTVHCDNWFNANLPWYNDPDVAGTREARKRRYEMIGESADRVLAVSEFLKGRLMEQFGIAEKKIAVVGNGVEDIFFAPGELPPAVRHSLDGRPYLVIVGGLTRRKGGEYLRQLLPLLRDKMPDLRIVVCGRSEVRYAGISQECANVIELGYIDAAGGLPALLAGAVALLFPSRYETFGIPALEAMASGAPPIVSRFGALPEVVGNAGIVLEDEDPGRGLAAVQSLMTDQGLHSSLITAGRIRAEQFRWERCVQRILSTLGN